VRLFSEAQRLLRGRVDAPVLFPKRNDPDSLEDYPCKGMLTLV
jgi:hypothetical protein